MSASENEIAFGKCARIGIIALLSQLSQGIEADTIAATNMLAGNQFLLQLVGGSDLPAGGDRADPNRCNFRGTGIGATSPVGCFYGGQRPYGCQDVSGGLWDWTHGGIT